MFNNKKQTGVSTTWSEMMLKEFLDSIYPGRMPLCEIPLLIKEKITQIDFNSDEPTAKHIKYRGFLAMKGLENVYFGLSTWEEETEDNRSFIGYLELLNGRTDEEGEHVPMIRGFIKRPIELFETVDVLMRDAKIFKSNNPIILNFHVDYQVLSRINTENLLNTKIGIRHIEVYQRLITFS